MFDQLIKKLNFNPKDPFEFKVDIFSDKIKTIVPDHSQFVENFYRAWLVWAFNGELESTVVYPGIINGIKNKKYEKYLATLSEDECIHLCGHFAKIAHDESEHTGVFLNLIKNTYTDSINKEVSKETIDAALRDAQDKVDNTDLMELLFLYYIGECHLQVCFYQIYKKTTNPDIRTIFKKILVDESQHNNNHYKLIKKVRDKITIDSSYYIQLCRIMKFFGQEFIKNKFQADHNDPRRVEYITKLIYNSPWHKEFNQLVIKKWYQLFEVLYPNISIEEFTKSINE